MITVEVLLISFDFFEITFEFHFTLDNVDLVGIITKEEKC